MSSSTILFVENVKKCMDKYKVSQSDLAKKLGMHQPAITRILSGNNVPSLDTVEKIASVFGLRADQILADGAEKKSSAPREVSFEEALSIVLKAIEGLPIAYEQIDELIDKVNVIESRLSRLDGE